MDISAAQRARALRVAARSDDPEAVEDLLRSGDADYVRLVATSDPDNVGAVGSIDELKAANPEAADTLLAIDDPTIRQQFVQAYDSGDLSSDQLATALQRYKSLDADTQEAFRETIQTSGPASMKLASTLDKDSLETVLDTGPRVMADGGGIMDELARAVDDANVDIDDPDAWVKKNLDSLDHTAKSRAKDFIDDTDAAGVRLVDELDSSKVDSLIDIDTTANPAFRQQLAEINANPEVESNRVGEYIENVEDAQNHANIRKADDLLEFDNTRVDGFRGSLGESRSALRYANDGYKVEMKPGGSDDSFDLKLSKNGDSQFVEVKTRIENEVEFQWVSRKIEEVNGKFDREKASNGLPVKEENTKLEIQTDSPSSKKDEIQHTIEQAVNTKQINDETIRVSEIRVELADGSTFTVEV